MTIVGGTKQEQFNQFIQELAGCDLGPVLASCHGGVQQQYIIFDNAPCHKGVETRVGDCLPLHVHLVCLPPYSCTLNPIEYCFQTLKAHMKCRLSEHSPVVAAEGQGLYQARRQLLLDLSQEALTEISPACCLNSYYHVLTVMAPKAARLEDM